MIIYQVKITIEAQVEQDWLDWMKRSHVPELIATGLVQSYQIWKSREASNTYYFQYYFENQTDLDQYFEDFAPQLRAHPKDKFPDLFTASRQIFDWI